MVDDWCDELGVQCCCRGVDRCGCVGAHATSVCTSVTFANTLVVLGEGQSNAGDAVAQCNEGYFGANESFFKHDVANSNCFADCYMRLDNRFGYNNTLATCKTGLFDHDRSVKGGAPCDCGIGISFWKVGEVRARQIELLCKLARKYFGGFKHAELLCWSKDFDINGVKRIGETSIKCGLWANDHQVDMLLCTQRNDALHIGDSDIVSLAWCAGIAWCDK